MKKFQRPNIFMILVIVAGFAGVFRIADIAFAVEESKEQPPPLTKADVAKSVQDTTKALATAPPDAPTADSPKVELPATPPSAAADAQQPSFSTSEINVLQSLAKRRDELDAREKTLSQREALLKAAEQEVDSKVAELNKLKTAMETLLGQQQKAQDDRIGSLVKIYENMKPTEAARIFDSLDMDILLEVIGRMNERKVSPVLASMNPEKAKEVTIKLADQRKLPAAAKEAVGQKAPAVPAVK